MAQTIKLKRSATQGATPATSALELGEVAINTYDGKMFIKKDDGSESIVEIGAGGGLSDIVEDTTPQLGGDLDLNSNDITGTGNVDITGTLTASALTIDTNTLSVDATNNRVGIGTSSPNYSLHVNESSDNTVRFQITNSNTGTGVGDGFQIIQNGSAQSNKVNLLNYENSALGIWTNNTERLHITASGNVGIGTSSPSRTFHSKGASGVGTVAKLESGVTSGTETVYLQLSSTGQSDADSGYISYKNTREMGFWTADTERMTIDSSGVVTSGTMYLGGSQIMSSSASLQVNGFQRTGTIYLHEGTSAVAGNNWALSTNSSGHLDWGGTRFDVPEISFGDGSPVLSDNGHYLRIQTSSGYTDIGSGNSSYTHFYTDRGRYYFNKGITVDQGVVESYDEDLILRRARSSSYQMTLSTSGATFTHNVTAYSDGRLKEDVKPIENALDTVEKLEGVTYTRKDNQEKNIGFIAQQIEENCPELAERVVGEMNDERKTKHVNYANMVALLVEAVKELKAEVDELKAAK